MQPSRTLALLLLAPLLLLASCVKTGDFWNHKVVLASDLTPSALDGQWEGSWQSYEFYDNGLVHLVIVSTDVAPPSATLPAVTSPAAPGTSRYLAQVEQWHYGILAPEKFNMVLITTAARNGQIQFHGERDLGPLEGSCKYDGFVENNKAVLSYVSRKDFGSLTLHRVVNAH